MPDLLIYIKKRSKGIFVRKNLKNKHRYEKYNLVWKNVEA